MADSVENSPVDEGKPTKKITSKRVDPMRYFLEEKYVPPKTILLLGDENIGKTTFIQNYCKYAVNYNRCSSYDGPKLVFTQFIINHKHDDKSVPIELMDLPPGTTEESRMAHYPDAIELIVLCFAIDNKTSYANVWEVWLPETRKHYPDFNRFYLLGLREDKRQEMLEKNEELPVFLDEAREIHQKHNFCRDYMECSVESDHDRAVQVMLELISDVLSQEVV